MVTATSVPDLSSAAMSPTGEVQKICITCGLDVTHKGRVKDSRGYMCVACSKAEAEATKIKGIRCADCGRKVPESGLFDYAGLKICQFCRDDRVKKAKHDRKFGTVGDKTYRENAKKQVYLLLGVVGVLLLIIVLHHFKLLGSMF
jgi:DNA-directed RNA polymerase subunit RPC12/RpoP